MPLIEKPVQKLLKDDARGFGIEHVGRRSSFAQTGFGLDRRITLVDPAHRQIETPVYLFAEALRQPGHLMWRAVRMTRQADHERVGLPFADQFADSLETIIPITVGNDHECTSLARQHVADRDADALFAIVEGKQRRLTPDGRVHAWPASPDNIDGDTPSNASAAVKRSSAGTSNRIRGSASTVSHPFFEIS